MAVGFAITRNNEWGNIYYEHCGGFPDEVIQGFLLDYFTVDGEAVDPYDGALFAGHQLDILASQLKRAIAYVLSQPPDWPFTNPEQVVIFHQRCHAFRIEHLSPRDHALKTLNRAIELAHLARELNESLAFVGD